mgnify:CR=1 FL=1
MIASLQLDLYKASEGTSRPSRLLNGYMWFWYTSILYWCGSLYIQGNYFFMSPYIMFVEYYFIVANYLLGY